VNEHVADTAEDAGPAPIDPRRALILPLWRGRYLVLAATLLGFAGGVLAGIIRPNSFRSVGKLMIRAGLREEQTPEMSVTGSAAGYGMGGRNVVNDELHLLSADQVFEEVARIVTPAVIFTPYDPSALDNEDTPALLSLFHRGQSWWFRSASDPSDRPNHPIDDCDQCRSLAALALMRTLSLQGEPGSNVITVSYSAHDARLAQRVVAAFLEAAIKQHRLIYETDTTLEFLSGQMEESLKDLTTAENDFTNFKTECGVVDFDKQQPALLTEIQELTTHVAQDQAQLESLRASTKELAKQVAAMPETIEERTEHNPTPNPERTRLKDRISTLQDKLAELQWRVGGTTESLEKERVYGLQQLESAKKSLQDQQEFVDAGPSVRTLANPQRLQRVQQLNDRLEELTKLEAAASIRISQLDERRKYLQSMEQCKPTFVSLSAKTSDARNRYDSFRARHERASLMGSMDQRAISNLRRIEDATLPDEKEGPLRGKLVLLGLLLGAVAGCGLAFVRSMFDHRLHDAIEVEQLLGSSVLAVLPQVGPFPKRRVAARPSTG
jgi:uncharacterized protein involved in exopolysaccharide biosynthesis